MPCFEVRAPARLHFGLLEINELQPHRFGGLGCMVQEPSLVLRATPSSRWSVLATPVLTQRVNDLMDRYRSRNPTHGPPLQLEVVKTPLAHAGFGTGTQLACSVVTLLQAIQRFGFDHTNSWTQRAATIWHGAADGPEQPAAEQSCKKQLELATGRGMRSHIGLEGFLHGGIIVDRGEVDQSEAGPRTRAILPDDASKSPDWHMVIVVLSIQQDVSGNCEAQYFKACSSNPNPNRARMLALTTAIEKDVRNGFRSQADRSEKYILQVGHNLFEYGLLAGELFQSVQFSQFRTECIHQMVHDMRTMGVAGVGQSSWGPAVFGLVASRESAQRIAKMVGEQTSKPIASIHISPLNWSGANLSFTPNYAEQRP